MKQLLSVRGSLIKATLIVGPALAACLVIIFRLFFAGVPPSFAQNTCQLNGLNQGLISGLSVTGGTIGNTDQTCVLNTQAAYRAFNVPSYTDLEKQFYTFSRSTAKKSPGNLLPSSGSWNFNQDGIYLQFSGVTLSAVTGNGVQVIFIRGDLNITGNIDYAAADLNSGLVFVVSGDINIDTAVTNVNAVLISGGKICTAMSSGVCNLAPGTTPQLTINGSLISLNETALPAGQAAIQLARNLANNTNTPAEVINKQPKFLYILRNNIFTDNLTLIQEDKNYVIPAGGAATPTPTPTTAPTPTPTPLPPCPHSNPLSITTIQSIGDCFLSI